MRAPLPPGGLPTGRDVLVSDGRDCRLSTTAMTDPAIFGLELERVFDRTWSFVAHESEVPTAGRFVTRWIGRDPVIVTRAADGEIVVMLNVCSHRASRVCAAEAGTTRTFRCPYHGWTYGTDGRLVGVPSERAVFGSELDRSTLGLERARVINHLGLVFATFDDAAPPLEDELGIAAFYLPTMFGLTDNGLEVLGEPQRWTIGVNWKIPADNFGGDPYHVSTAHGSLTSMGLVTVRDSDTQRVVGISDPEHGHCLECTVLAERDEADDARLARACRMHGVPEALAGEVRERLTPAQLDSLLRYPITVGTLFPNFSFLRSPLRTTMDEPAVPAFSIRVWRPVAPDATEVWSWALAHRDAPDDVKARMASAVARTFGSSGIAEQDDAEIWTGMQQGFAGVRGRQRWLRFRPHLEPDPGWRAPGFARFGPQGEHRQWNFYRRWYELLCT